ncbi:hypothetical protein [Cryptosporangium japonicum]|uniref:Uncharacterized protein n=1 Tax=Cryptosporangium japonicum TaxID=80872 RepID=A0ABN0UJF1_9ACTN
MTCTGCGAQEFDEGFLEDGGESSRGYTRWIEGPLQRGIFGGARTMGKPRREVRAFRCRQCGHLELYAGDYV